MKIALRSCIFSICARLIKNILNIIKYSETVAVTAHSTKVNVKWLKIMHPFKSPRSSKERSLKINILMGITSPAFFPLEFPFRIYILCQSPKWSVCEKPHFNNKILTSHFMKDDKVENLNIEMIENQTSSLPLTVKSFHCNGFSYTPALPSIVFGNEHK